jgi:endogenous inhibitor of DNA gyrase (YacG/DUF329 family)
MPAGFHCRLCRREIAPGAPFFPFCSERCRNLDLGHWLFERYRIGGRPDSEEEEAEKEAAGEEE